MLKCAASIVASGVRLIVLLALSGDGALRLPRLRLHTGAVPALMAAAIEGRDINLWAAGQGIAGTRAS